MSEPLTDRQKEVLRSIKAHMEKRGIAPSRADIASDMGFSSANAAQEHLAAIERKGCIRLLRGVARGIVITPRGELALIGVAA